ncbi:facilitated trehalose transporter Tret1-2, partial [Aphis craccivora]
VIFTFASSQLVDRAGRRVLWQISDFVMATFLGTLAFYFWLHEYGVDVSSFKLIPFISLGLYISTFALGLGPTPSIMIGESFSPEIKGLVIGTMCVLDSLIEFCVVKTYQMVTDVEALKRRFAVVFQLSVVMDSPAPREVAVFDETTGARLGALEDAVRSLLVVDAPRSIEARLDALEDAVRSLSGQLEALGANREPKKQQAQARTATPSTWCYYHTKYGKDARKCGNVLCTFAPKILNQNQTFKKSHV